MLLLIFSAEAALHLPELKTLDLSWNKCVGGNLKLILKALNLGGEIRVLRLSSCALMDEDLSGLGWLKKRIKMHFPTSSETPVFRTIFGDPHPFPP